MTVEFANYTVLARQLANPVGLHPGACARFNPSPPPISSIPMPYDRHERCDLVLLVGELGSIIANMGESTKYDDEYIETFDDNEPDKNKVIALLYQLEDDGFPVDWLSCIPKQIFKDPWHTRLKKWAIRLIRKMVNSI